MFKPGEKFNAIRKSNDKPVLIKDRLAEFTVVKLVSVLGEPEWYECKAKGNPLPWFGCKPRYYQLFTRYFDFHAVI